MQVHTVDNQTHLLKPTGFAATAPSTTPTSSSCGIIYLLFIQGQEFVSPPMIFLFLSKHTVF